MSAPNENVLVIRRELFDQLGSFHGLNFEPQKYLDAFLSRGNNFFLRRAEAEINPAYKQIIPYALIAFQNKVAYYVRGKKTGEQRNHGNVVADLPGFSRPLVAVDASRFGSAAVIFFNLQLQVQR